VRLLACVLSAVLVTLSGSVAAAQDTDALRTLDGSHNNLEHPDWGRANTVYPRIAGPNYADGKAVPVAGPPTRYVSNRIFNDTSQNLFSENGVTQWGAVWGQFLDHTFGLRQETGGERAPISFDPEDPLEDFRNDLGSIAFDRTPAAPGTGTSSPREQLNGVGGYIDASSVYGDSAERLRWLRESRDGDAGAHLFLPGGYLPGATARGDAASAPAMALMGRLLADPSKARIAGDVRANENISLTATHTLFAREHNRIVDALPRTLSAEERFQIARHVVGAEQQYITYNEFLPALGIRLSPYRGYDPRVNAAITNEFAVVGYRAHSMIHGEIETSAPVGAYPRSVLDAFAAGGLEVEVADGVVGLVVPLNVAFGNPDLLQGIGLGPALRGIGAEAQYKNDEQIDNQLRSVLFQVPGAGAADASACLDGPTLPGCFTGVADLAAIDIERGRDHGMPAYNELRRAYGLAPKRSFTAITGEDTHRLASDAQIDPDAPLDDPDILDFVSLRDGAGAALTPGTPEADAGAVTGVRRTTLAARLHGIYSTVDKLDAFVGMSAERHVAGTEFGELQLAIWTQQFEHLRDGDRFFHLGDPELSAIERRYGISYRQTLAQIIASNTGEVVQPNVFKAAP
jgi:hypothetical protein